MANTLADGQKVTVKGSSSTYELARAGTVYSCTCPAWRNQGAPVGLRTCDVVGAESAAGAGDVLHDHLLAQFVRHLLRNDATDRVCGSA